MELDCLEYLRKRVGKPFYLGYLELRVAERHLIKDLKEKMLRKKLSQSKEQASAAHLKAKGQCVLGRARRLACV